MALVPARALATVRGLSSACQSNCHMVMNLRGLRKHGDSTGDLGDPPLTKLWGVNSLTMVREEITGLIDRKGPKLAGEHHQL